MVKQLSHSEAERLVDGLRVTVDFIRTNIPPNMIAARQTRGWERANAALSLKPNTDKNASTICAALVWAFSFVCENYKGRANELTDTIRLLSELGFINSKTHSIQ